MSKTILYKLFFILLIFNACTSKKQHALIDNMDIQGSVNGAAIMLSSNYMGVFFQDSAIVGYSNQYAFSSNNFFRTFWTLTTPENPCYYGYPVNTYYPYIGFPSLVKLTTSDTSINLLNSNDYGATYNDMASLPIEKDGIQYYYAYNFISENEGWIYQYRRNDFPWTPESCVLYKIKDNNLQLINNLKASDSVYLVSKMKFVDSQKGWAIFFKDSRYYLKYTLDGGVTWTKTGNPNLPLNDYTNLTIQNKRLVLWQYGYTCKLYTPKDDFYNDAEIVDFPGYFPIFSMLNQNTGFALTQNGEVWKTSDAGRNWILRHTFEDHIVNQSSGTAKQIEFRDENVGFVNLGKMLFYTKDGGANWSISIMKDY